MQPARFAITYSRLRGETRAAPDFVGPGELCIEPDFMVLRGRLRRWFRYGPWQEERLRLADIVNVCADGAAVRLDVLGVQRDRTLTFDAADAAAAARIAALLPQRQTTAFVQEEADRALFAERIDHFTPSTPVTWALFALNVIVYLLMWWDRLGTGAVVPEGVRLAHWGSNVGPLTLGGQWWRLLTSMFVHGGLLHILFNMAVLLQAGRLVERMFGSARFLALYVVAGVAGSLASVLWNPMVNSVGASGALFGIIGGLFAFMRRPDSGVPGTIMRELRGSLSGFLLFNIVAGLVYPHTDNAAHIGGLAGGYLAGLLLSRSLLVNLRHKH